MSGCRKGPDSVVPSRVMAVARLLGSLLCGTQVSLYVCCKWTVAFRSAWGCFHLIGWFAPLSGGGASGWDPGHCSQCLVKIVPRGLHTVRPNFFGEIGDIWGAT